MKSEVIYVQTGAEGLDIVTGLWRKLRQHHKERSLYFKEEMDKVYWEERKQELLNKTSNGMILVEIAKNNDKLTGYCISSVSGNKEGEIESIYIEKEYRKRGIGDHFMKTALAWMGDHGATRKIIGVAVGNEETFGFYRKYNFYPRVTILRQK